MALEITVRGPEHSYAVYKCTRWGGDKERLYYAHELSIVHGTHMGWPEPPCFIRQTQSVSSHGTMYTLERRTAYGESYKPVVFIRAW